MVFETLPEDAALVAVTGAKTGRPWIATGTDPTDVEGVVPTIPEFGEVALGVLE